MSFHPHWVMTAPQLGDELLGLFWQPNRDDRHAMRMRDLIAVMPEWVRETAIKGLWRGMQWDEGYLKVLSMGDSCDHLERAFRAGFSILVVIDWAWEAQRLEREMEWVEWLVNAAEVRDAIRLNASVAESQQMASQQGQSPPQEGWELGDIFLEDPMRFLELEPVPLTEPR